MSKRLQHPASRYTGRTASIAAAFGLALLLVACGSKAHNSPAASTGTGLMHESTSIGTVLAAPSGLTVYELVGATSANSSCTGGCQTVWPPVESGGHQVVVNGHPAYTFSGDSASGQVHGQGVSDTWGKWYALDSSGNPITAAMPTSTSTTSGGSSYGGGGY